MFDFPNSPTVGQNTTAPNGAVFVWDGAKWTTVANAATIGAGGPFLPLSGGTVTGPLNWTSTGSTASRAAQDRTAETVNVKDFGAIGDGTTDDTTAVQAAANAITASGDVLLFPPGVYVVNTSIAVRSNTYIHGQGATLLAKPTGFVGGVAPLLTNQNNGVTTLTDHDIVVDGLTLDLGTTAVTGHHAVLFAFVRNVAVVGCTIQCRGQGNAVSLIGCYNSLIDGCTAYAFTNCGYDHWWGPSNARVVNCYAETATSGQMVNFNPDSTSGTPSGLTAQRFVLANCTLVGTGSSAIPSQIETLGSSGFVRDVVVKGNTFVNSYLAMRGAVTGATIAGNTFDGMTGGGGVLFVYTNTSGSPVNFAITGNTFVNPGTTSGSVMQVYTNTATVVGNVVTGALTVPALDVSTFNPVVAGNSLSGTVNGTPAVGPGSFTTLGASGNTTVGGTLGVTGSATFSNGAIWPAVGASSNTNLAKHIDLFAGIIGLCIDPSGGFSFVAGGSGANVYVNGPRVASFTSNGLDSTVVGATAPAAGTFSQVMVGSTTGPTWTTGSAVPASVQPVGSLYSRVSTWAAGATLYVSKGAGAWTAVAGV